VRVRRGGYRAEACPVVLTVLGILAAAAAAAWLAWGDPLALAAAVAIAAFAAWLIAREVARDEQRIKAGVPPF